MSEMCDVPGCDQQAVELVANDAGLSSPEYAERQVCRWHRRNPFAGMGILSDPRVEPDSFVVYPTDYALIPYSDKDSWALTVTNGHAYGWSIRPGIGMSGSVALNRKGDRIIESRRSGHNKARRWPLEDALEIALSIVDKHKVAGRSAAEVVANRERIIASFEHPAADDPRAAVAGTSEGA